MAVALAGPYASLHLTPDRKPRHHSVFTARMPFLPLNQQCQSTEGTSTEGTVCSRLPLALLQASPSNAAPLLFFALRRFISFLLTCLLTVRRLCR